jgi:hypothetical protein
MEHEQHGPGADVTTIQDLFQSRAVRPRAATLPSRDIYVEDTLRSTCAPAPAYTGCLPG